MYIVSRFHDYYDTAASYGIDKSCVYKRDSLTEKITLKKGANAFKNWRWIRYETMDIRRFIVGFCGEIYPGAIITIKEDGKPDEKIVTYRHQELDVLAEKYKAEGWLGRRRRYFSNLITEIDFWNTDTWDFLKDNFQKYKTPVFCIIGDVDGDVQISINQELKKLEFYKVMPPPMAFQEIFMFISGVLGTGERETVEISDEVMLEKKGFFGMSFKKDPGQKKRGKKK